jgi:Flp pilus assembly pilin Flp
MMLRKRKQKGAALVEYGLLVAGVALVATAAISIFGTKTSGLIASVATVLPGVQSVDNAPIEAGQLIETTDADTGLLEVDITQIDSNTNTERLSNNVGVDVHDLVLDTDEQP